MGGVRILERRGRWLLRYVRFIQVPSCCFLEMLVFVVVVIFGCGQLTIDVHIPILDTMNLDLGPRSLDPTFFIVIVNPVLDPLQ